MSRSIHLRGIGRPVAIAVALAVALLVMLPAAALAQSPITWSPGSSLYSSAPGGEPNTPFIWFPPPATQGIGMTQSFPGAATAYGVGAWDEANGVYGFGFVGTIPTGPPSIQQAELAGKDIGVGTALDLVFTKAPGQKVNFVALTADPNGRVFVLPEAGKTLTESATITVRARITDPVASAGGNVSAAFGLIIDCSSNAFVDFRGSAFVTDMIWFDIAPPTTTTVGRAGLNANGVDGVWATFAAIFPLEQLAAMGVADPAAVAGFIDTSWILAGASWATFDYLGAGDGSLWPAGWHKYRITNKAWSKHNMLFGRATKPGQPSAKSPKGLVDTSTKPRFKWGHAARALSYEVRVYKGATKLVGKTGITADSWKCTKALPKGKWLVWKVRAVNGAGASAWSSLKFKIY